MRICLDPGHGRKRCASTGAYGNGIVEDDWALEFCRRLGHYLRSRGAEVVTTRPDSHFVELKERGKLAKREGADLFLSIHLNAAGSPQANGAELFVVSGDKRSIVWAQQLLAVVVGAGMNRRGVKPDTSSAVGKLRVLRDTYRAMPAMLLEVGFLSNQEDAERLKSIHWRERLACELAKAILTE